MNPLLIPILINKLSKRINVLEKSKLDEFKISKLHVIYLLALFYKNDGYTLKELSSYLGYDKANTTRAINHLLSLGYAKKNLNENLKFKYSVVLTKKGKEIAQNIVINETKDNEQILSIFSPEELNVLKGAIDKLIEYLE